MTPAEPQGPLGDGDLHPGRYNMRLVRRAIKNGWNVPEKYKEGVVTQMAKVAFGSLDERNRIAASRVLLEADKADQAFQMGEEADEGNTYNTQVNVHIEQPPAITEQGRINQVVALLDRVGERIHRDEAGAAPHEVHPPPPNGTPNGVPSP